MADIRINALPTTATDFASDDYIAIDGTTNGTRKLNAKTANLTFSDVTLGTSGPSVKSTLSARAPRQGLVFDGTNGVTATLGSALGTSAFSWSGWVQVPSTPALYNVLGGVGTTTSVISVSSGFSLIFQNTGKLRIQILNAAANGGVYADVDGFSSLVGKIASLSVTRSGTTLAVYINGIAQTVTPVTFGSSPGDFSNTIAGTTVIVGGSGGGSGTVLSGYVSGPFIYNRALSASEVVALYEAGAPAGADYNSASNTNISADTFVNGTGAATFSGASATAFTISGTTGGAAGTAGRAVYGTDLGASLRIGTKYRVTFSATITSGEAPIVAIGHSGTGYASNQVTVTNGTNTLELTIDTTRASNRLLFVSSHSTAINYSVSSLVWTRLGLLLAPDAAQAGGGLVWYDTSGNAANITLPASGVSWNVPTSGYVTSGSSLNLSAGGTNQNITLTPSGTGVVAMNGGVSVQNTQNLNFAYPGNSSLATGRIGWWSGSSLSVSIGQPVANALSFVVSGAEAARFAPTTGNFLIGGTIDGGQKLQVAGTALIAPSAASANIFFVRNTASNGYSTIQFENTTGTAKGYIGYGNTGTAVFPDQFYIAGPSSIVLAPGGYTTGLTLDGSQRVITASTLNVGSGTNDSQFINVFTNKVQNTSGPVTINLPADSSGVVTLYSSQGGIGKSMWQIPYINDGGTVQLGTAVKTIKTADPVSSAVAATGAITVSVVAANTYCYWGINCVKP